MMRSSSGILRSVNIQHKVLYVHDLLHFNRLALISYLAIEIWLIKRFICTFSKVGKWFQNAPPESSHRVLDTGAQTKHALQVGLFEQQLSVSTQLVCSAQQGRNAVHKLRYQASVCVICLAIVIRHHLEHKEERKRKGKREGVWINRLKQIKNAGVINEHCVFALTLVINYTIFRAGNNLCV